MLQAVGCRRLSTTEIVVLSTVVAIALTAIILGILKTQGVFNWPSTTGYALPAAGGAGIVGTAIYGCSKCCSPTPTLIETNDRDVVPQNQMRITLVLPRGDSPSNPIKYFLVERNMTVEDFQRGVLGTGLITIPAGKNLALYKYSTGRDILTGQEGTMGGAFSTFLSNSVEINIRAMIE